MLQKELELPFQFLSLSSVLRHLLRQLLALLAFGLKSSLGLLQLSIQTRVLLHFLRKRLPHFVHLVAQICVAFD